MMLTTRLRHVYQQEQKQRKYVCVMNDVAKTQQDRYDHIIDTEKAEATQRSRKTIEMTRRNLVRQRVLKKFMQNTREDIEKRQATTMYGKYHGVSVDHIAEEVEQYLKTNHPQVRRAQKIKDLFEEGYETGAILDKETVRNKVKHFFDKPLVELHRIPEVDEISSNGTDVLPSVAKDHFYTADVGKSARGTQNIVTLSNENKLYIPKSEHESDNVLFIRRKVNKFLTEDVPDKLSETSEENITPHRGKDKVRPVTLPPIKIGIDSEDICNTKQSRGSIAELAAKFAKVREKTEMLHRRQSRSQISKKQTESAAHVGKTTVTRRPKSERIGNKDVKVNETKYKFKEKKADKMIQNKITQMKASKHDKQHENEEHDKMLDSSLPPLKFKSSSKRFV